MIKHDNTNILLMIQNEDGEFRCYEFLAGTLNEEEFDFIRECHGNNIYRDIDHPHSKVADSLFYGEEYGDGYPEEQGYVSKKMYDAQISIEQELMVSDKTIVVVARDWM